MLHANARSSIRDEARRHYLDVLRGLAAILVLVSHADHSRQLDLGLTTLQKGFIGALGVYIFFILSGYLIWTSAQGIRKPGGLTSYGVHRVTRLLPLYLLNLLFVVLLLPHLPSSFHPSISVQAVLRHLTFTQSLLPDVSRDLNPVLWTLTHEALYYALVPLLLFVPVLVIPGVALAALLSTRLFQTPLTPFLALFYLFAIGILLAEKRKLGAVLAGAVFTACSIWMGMPGWKTALIPVSVLIVLTGLALPGRALWLTLPLRWAGVISFSLYIWHYLVINMIGTAPGMRVLARMTGGASWTSDLARSAASMTLIFGTAVVSYYVVERPSMNQLRARLLAWLRGPSLTARPRASS